MDGVEKRLTRNYSGHVMKTPRRLSPVIPKETFLRWLSDGTPPEGPDLAFGLHLLLPLGLQGQHWAGSALSYMRVHYRLQFVHLQAVSCP